MNEKKWKIEATRVDGQLESIYLLFGKPERARETMRWTRKSDSAHLLIDIGELDLPIAMQLVNSFGSPESEGDGGDAFDPEEAVRELFAFANKMIAFRRASEDALSEPLIDESIRRATPLASPTSGQDLQPA